jgi:hypothetical protein
MSRSRTLATTAAVASITLAGLLVASPASAAALPDGQRITVVSNYYGNVNAAPSYDANPADAVLTALGGAVGLTEGEFVSGIDVNVADGLGYAIITSRPDGWGESWIAPYNAATGVAGTAIPIVDDEDNQYNGCLGLDLYAADGRYYTACFDNASGNTSAFGWVDPTTGELTELNEFAGYEFTEFASDPVTGRMFAFRFINGDADTYEVYEVLTNTWSFTPIDDLAKPVWGADFDRDGKLFVSTYLHDNADADYGELDLLNPLTAAFTVIDFYTANDSALEDDQLPLTIWGQPALAATGGLVDAVPLGLGAALLLLAGAAFVATRRIQREN